MFIARRKNLRYPLAMGLLAEPMDGKGAIQLKAEYSPVFREAPATMDRSVFNSPLVTGTKIIDAVMPFAKGQRHLIIGDRMTGKTTVAVDAILNQKDKGVICVYCCIGKSFSSLSKIAWVLKEKAAFKYTAVFASLASAAVGEQYIVPYSACALGEYFMYKGLDVLVVFDDLTKHAWAYRQLSLLLERPPGREAYPGDIYYIHSQLMERSGSLKKELGGGSMTFLAVTDTLEGDVTRLVPSNLISMADGQVYLSAALFTGNFKPAIDLLMSFSNTRGGAQNPVLKILAKGIFQEYARYKELLRLTKIKSNLTPETENIIHRGEILNLLFCQDKHSPVSIEELIVLLYAFNSRVLDSLDLDKVNSFKNEIWGYVIKHSQELARVLKSAKELTPEISKELDEVLGGFNSNQYDSRVEKTEIVN